MPIILLAAMTFYNCENEIDLDPVDPAAIEDSQISVASKGRLNTRSVTTCTIGPNDHLCRTRNLIAGQNYVVGTVKVYCTDGTNDYKVVYDVTAPGCYLSEVHVYAGSEAGIPKTKSGCPKVGHFPGKLEGLSTTTACVDVGSLPDEFTVAAHAVVKCYGSDSPFYGEETAWADGKRFPDCNNWSECFVVDCKK